MIKYKPVTEDLLTASATGVVLEKNGKKKKTTSVYRLK